MFCTVAVINRMLYLHEGTVTINLDKENRLVEILFAVSHQMTN